MTPEEMEAAIAALEKRIAADGWFNGLRTSEHFGFLVTAVGAGLWSVVTRDPVVISAGLVATGLAAGLYAVSRGLAKTTPPIGGPQ